MSASDRIRRTYYRSDTEWQADLDKGLVGIGLQALSGIGILLLVSMVFIAGYDYLIRCDYFRASQIVIQGGHHLSHSEVARIARVSRGVNILSVNLEKTRKYLAASPWIASAEVSRELPGKIGISITEHMPVAVIDLGRRFLLGDQGEIFKKWEAGDPESLPLISGLSFSDINTPDKPRSRLFEVVMELMALGKAPDSVLPNRFIAAIHVDRELGVTIYASGPDKETARMIKLGFYNYPGKYERLKSVFRLIGTNPEFSMVETIDLTDMNRIVVNPVDPVRAGFGRFDEIGRNPNL